MFIGFHFLDLACRSWSKNIVYTFLVALLKDMCNSPNGENSHMMQGKLRCFVEWKYIAGTSMHNIYAFEQLIWETSDKKFETRKKH